MLQVVFGEDENGNAHHVMGIVHNAAAYLPDRSFRLYGR